MCSAVASARLWAPPSKCASVKPLQQPGARRCRQLRNLRQRHVLAALTESGVLAVGTPAPPFQLTEPLTGKTVALSDLTGQKVLLVMFICNHCPFVKLLTEAIVQLTNEYQSQGVASVAISSNSILTHPQDGPEEMAQDARSLGYSFPYLYDEGQDVAKAYRAACTPEFYVFDAQQKLRYHGQFDSARPSGNTLVTGEDLRRALDAVLQGQSICGPVRPSIGCNIKWHPGNEPAY